MDIAVYRCECNDIMVCLRVDGFKHFVQKQANGIASECRNTGHFHAQYIFIVIGTIWNIAHIDDAGMAQIIGFIQLEVAAGFDFVIGIASANLDF